MAPAQGQTVRDEGFPAKPVSPEAFSHASGDDENCVAALFPGEFEERCIEDNEANPLNPFGERRGASPFEAPDPLWNAPPRLDCPSAVFLEEMETASIDCRAWDASGQEASEDAIDYAWERAGGGARDYMEHPRLTPQDVPNPLLVAPSSPFYDTLESFLAEETTKKYRYRLRATSRATGLSSFAEVDVFVLLNRPSVHCPLEVQVEEGSTVALSCEGADPLSFRMDEEAGSSAAWRWEGLWSASTSALSATDLPAPLFRAPLGAAGETFHYVASMTTTSSGVPRTARRKVSVTVVESENAGLESVAALAARDPAPTLTCVDFEVYPTASDFRLDCTVTDEPADAAYSWAGRGAGQNTDRLNDTSWFEPRFSMRRYYYNSTRDRDILHEYTLTLSAPGIEDVTEEVTVTILKMPDLMDCDNDYEISPGSSDFNLNCTPKSTDRGTPRWDVGPGPLSAGSRSIFNMRLDRNWLPSKYAPKWNPLFSVPESLPDGTAEDYYQFYICASYSHQPSGYPGVSAYRIVESEYVTVKVVDNRPAVTVACTDPEPVPEGDADFDLSCSASGAPAGSEYTYVWTARGYTSNTDRLIANADGPTPTFAVPPSLDEDANYEYRLAVSAENMRNGIADVTVKIIANPQVRIDCPGNPYEVREGTPDIAMNCSASGAFAGDTYEYAWTVRGYTKNMDRLVGDVNGPAMTFKTPPSLDAHDLYEYRLTVSAVGPKAVEDGVEDIAVVVLDNPDIIVDCPGNPYTVHEGVRSKALDCRATGAPDGAKYTYVWTARGSTPDTKRLVAGTDRSTPIFKGSPLVDKDETYEYRLTVSAPGADDGAADVTVTLRKKPAIAVQCANPDPVYEGSEDMKLACSATGAPADASYAWTARGPAENMDMLVANTDGPTPMFDVPDAVDANQTYEYNLRVSAAGLRDGAANVTVTVMNKSRIQVACATPDPAREGSADVTLACTATGGPAGSSYAYSWTARGASADLDMLSATNISSPTFDVPADVPKTTRYEYRLTASAANAENGMADVTVTVLNAGAIAVSCAGNPYSPYEGSGEIALDCSASGAPEGSAYAYSWTARGSTGDLDMLSAANIPSPTFSVPVSVDADETYEYRLTVKSGDMEDGAANVTVNVLKRPVISVQCADPDPVYEGAPDITLNCSVSGAPSGASYVWESRGSAADLERLVAGADGPTPTFAAPDEVPETKTYAYRLTVSAENAEPAAADVDVTVLKRGALAVSCPESPYSAYEGSPDVTFDCSASGAPEGSEYAYSWEALGAPADLDMLSAAEDPMPTFAVPDEVPQTTIYEYRLTVSAENAEPAAANVTVTVLKAGTIVVACADIAPVYEGAPDVALACTAEGAPDGSTYDYAWTALDGTADVALLSAADILSPTFAVPAEVDRDETYRYRLTVSAENAEPATADVSVTVLNKPAIVVACTDTEPVYEGSPDISLNCSAPDAPSDASYAWEARGATTDTDLLSAADIVSPMFAVPAAVDRDETYAYRLTVSAENMEPASVDITVTVLNKGALAVSCAGNPYSAYEGSGDLTLDCSATGAPEGSEYAYSWTARGAPSDLDMLSAADISSPMFAVPAEVDQNETYEYRLTVSAENAEPATADVTVTVLDKPSIVVACTDPEAVYEGSEDITLECSASGALEGSSYDYVWEARGATPDTDLLVAGADGPTPTFATPDAVDADETYEYRLTVSAENAEPASANVTVTVLDKPAIVVSCPGNPYSAYEGSEDITLECSASGAPEGSEYAYSWEVRGVTADTDRLSATDISSPTFAAPDAVERDETYEYRLTVSAENAEPASADITVTVLDRPLSDLAGLGLAVEASLLRFGVQAANTQVALDPLTDRITSSLSGLYHAGRMALALSDADAEAEAAFSIELLSPATLNLIGDDEAPPLALAPTWSYAASCEQKASTAIRGLSMEATLSESDDCRLLLFGGSLDLAGARSGLYEGAIHVVLRSGAAEETHSVPVEARVVPASRMITIGPGGARIDEATGMPAALTQEQNLSVYPDLAFLTDEAPSGAFTLSNPSLVPLEISVAARFGYSEATEDGREIVVEDEAASRLGDLSEWVDVHPRTLTLEPGEEGVVRYAMKASARSKLTEAGYAAFFEITSSPRQYVRGDQMPEVASGDKTARVTLRMPGAYAPGEGPSRLRAELLSLSQSASPSATFLVETEGRPFAGEMVAYDSGGEELGRGRAMVYTRSRVRMPLARTPEQGEAILLRFVPLHSDRAPEPVAIRWSTPGSDLREIGAAMDAEPPSLGVAPAPAGKR